MVTAAVFRRPTVKLPVLHIGAALALAGLLGGCASVPNSQRPPRYTYYVVPCDTPGAIMTGSSAQAAAPAAASAAETATPEGVAEAGRSVSDRPVCIVAASVMPRYAYRYAPYGYYGSRYGSPYYGSFGVSFVGGHHHHGGRHHGGGRH